MADNFDPEMMRKFVEALADATRQVDEITIGQRKEKEERDKNIQAIKQFGSSLVGASKQLGKAMVDASDSAGKYAGGIESAGNAAYDLGKNFGALGAVAGGLVSIFTKLVGASLRQQDALLKTYRTLSQFGDLDNSSFKGILTDLQSTGFAVNQNAERYVEAIRKVAPELSVFSGSVSEGRKQLVATFGHELKKTEKYLARFGYSTEEMFEKTGSMISQMAFTSNKNSISTAKLNAMSVTYMETLAALAELTGQSRDALDEQRKAQMNDLRWQIYLIDVQKKLGEKGVQAEQDRLLMIESVFGKDKAQGYISATVNAGRTMDEFSSRLKMMFGESGFRALREGIHSGGNQAVQFAEILNKLSPSLEHQFNTTKNLSALGNEYSKELGRDVETLRAMVLGKNIDAQKLQDLLNKKKDDAANSEIDAYTKRAQTERQIRIAYENMLQNAGPKINAALDKFVEIVYKTAKQMAIILKKIGGPDFTDAFRDSTDVLADMTKEQEKYKKLLENINRLEKQKEAYTKNGNTEMAKAIGMQIEQAKEDGLKASSKRLLALDRENTQLGGAEGSGLSRKDYATHSQAAGELADLDRVLPKARKTKYSRDEVTAKIDDLVSWGGGISGNKANFDKLKPEVQDAFIAMAYEYHRATGKKLQINSAHRTPEEQSMIDPGKNPIASPGNSLHQKGIALDLNSDQVSALSKWGILGKYGFSPLQGDPPHINYTGAANGGYFNGPNTGYLVEQHGPEATFNPKQLKALNNALTKTPISGGGSPTGQDVAFMELMTRISSVMESIANLQRDSNSIQEEILKYAKA